MTTDDALLTVLGSALQSVDPVPPSVHELARASLSWRNPDEALADLVSDSLLNAAQVRTPRGAGPRLLTFEADGVTIEVEVADDGESRRLLGQIVPPARAEVVVRWRSGQTNASVDEIGRFVASGIPAGPVSMSCMLENATKPVGTSWVTI